jgi:membrane-bound lytic murein transglycosylase B
MKTISLILITFIYSLNLYAKDYTKDDQAKDFMHMMSTKHNFKTSYLNELFSSVSIQKTPLKIYAKRKQTKTNAKPKRTYPVYGTWDRYVKYKVTPKRVKDGVSFLNKYQSTFKNVEKEYGIPKEYIAAIIGIESVYGKNVGKFPVFDTLATLAFEENRRNKFFKKQLEEFIVLSYKDKVNPKNIKGSYAGAMGLGQFMPSSYKHFGVDFNKDGKVSLHHPQDAIASVANYLKEHGWKTDEQIATRVSYKGNRFKQFKTGYHITYDRKQLKGIRPKYGKWNYFDKVRLIKLNKKHYDELWYAAKNFYVITRYNHSSYYAMSVHQLAQKIKTEISLQSSSLASNKPTKEAYSLQ